MKKITPLRKNSFIKFTIRIYLSLIAFTNCQDNNKQKFNLTMQDTSAKDHYIFTRPEPHFSNEEKSRPRDMILHFIKNAKNNIDIWCYGMNEKSIIKELVLAKKRGVKVRIVGSYDKNYTELIDANLIPQIRNSQTLQHAKAILIDKRILVSGTGNFTRSGLFHNNNLFFYIPIETSIYEKIIDRLEENNSNTNPIHIKAWDMQIIFSPKNGRYIQNTIIESIEESTNNINFLIFSHTDKVITSALLSKNQNGVIIEGIYDDMNNDGVMDKRSQGHVFNNNLGLSLSKTYLEGNQNVFIPNKETRNIHGGHLHHKTIVIDEKKVLTGSYNWSLNARDNNLEIFFIINNKDVAKHFNKEFQEVKKRSLLLARPPFPQEQSNAASIHYDSINDAFCLNNRSVSATHTVVVKNGGGLFSSHYLYNFTPDINCLPRKSKHEISAGILQSSLYDIKYTDHNNHSYTITPGRSFIFSQIQQKTCKHTADCSPLKIQSYFQDTKVLWFNQDLPSPPNIQLWTKTGLSDSFLLTKIGSGVYKVPQSIQISGDVMFFFSTIDSRSITHVACLQSGTTLATNLRNFKRFLLQRHNKYLSCYNI